MSQSPVVYAPAIDAAMSAASVEAQRTFKYFWRELTWEQRRIVPALELSAIKAAFADPGAKVEEVEHMWLGDVTFDGDVLEATLLNRPNTVRSVREGDRVPLAIDRLEDWMYAMNGRVHGGHTIQVLRARMNAAERRDHDDAWGFDFGDPSAIALVPAWPGNASRDPDVEHPMSENMSKALAERLAANRDAFLRSTDPSGLTMLHAMALGGSAGCVGVLLAEGADPMARTRSGKTPRMLAEQLAWPRVIELLTLAERRRVSS